MKRKRLLHVLGGGHWQLPTVQLAKTMGHRVLVTDKFSQRPAYAVADFHEAVDIDDPERTLAVAQRYGIDGIICDTTDVGVPTAAYVAERLGLPGLPLAAASNFCDKALMRSALANAGMTTPRYRSVHSESELEDAVRSVGLPAVLKPVDNQSGRGVSRIMDRAALSMGLRNALAHSRQGIALIEECLYGTEIIVDSFSVDAAVSLLGIARKTPYADNPTICSRITYPEDLPETMIAKVRETNERTLHALGLASGVSHAEYMMVGDELIALDVAARGGGVKIYTHVLPHVSGVDANRAMIEYAMGEIPRIEVRKVRKAASIDFLRMPSGILAELDAAGTAAMPGIAALHFNVGVGDVIGSLDDKDDRPGYIVALGDTLVQAGERAAAARARIRMRVVESATSEALTDSGKPV